MSEINTAITKQAARLESILAKKRELFEKQQASLMERLQKEVFKTKELTVDGEQIADLFSLIGDTASKNGVSVQRLMDFAAKQLIGETAKVVYRRKREPKLQKEPKVVAAKKVAAKKK